MPKDYAKRSGRSPKKRAASRRSSTQRTAKKSTSKKPGPGLWLLAGLLLGLFFSGLIFLKTDSSLTDLITHPIQHIKKMSMHFHHSSHHHNQKAHHKDSASTSVKNRHQLSNKPHFDFYTMLPKMKAWVPDQQNSRTQKKSEAMIKTTPQPLAYALQAASFKRASDADQLKAKLLLMGLDVDINQTKSNGITWSRVWIGPYKTKRKAKSAQNSLTKEKIKTIIIKIRA